MPSSVDDASGQQASSAGQSSTDATGASGAGASDGDPLGTSGPAKQPTYPQPDVSQMLPFKPKAYPRTGSHPVPGGEFPPPPAASALIHMLPPPECFHGPFVQVDKFLEHFMDLEIPEDYMAQVMAESEDMALNNIDAGTAISIEMSNAGGISGTGQIVEFLDSGDEGGAFDSDGGDDLDNDGGDIGDDVGSGGPDANTGLDLFRLRQAKRHHVMG